MGGQYHSKLNKILAQWPQNCVVTSAWLEAHGVYRQLAHKYVAGGWIKKLHSGAFQRPGDQISWQGGLFAVQKQLELPIHLGGASLLGLRGYGQHIPAAGKTPLNLYGGPGVELPKWFMRQPWSKHVSYSRKTLFSKPVGLTKYTTEQGLELISSGVERAFFEMIDDLAHLDFDQVYEVCERLSGLRPQVLQELLEKCNSYKVKRIFCFMANRVSYPWFKKLNLKKINLGTGKRVIVKNGSFDSNYQITIPKKYAEASLEK